MSGLTELQDLEPSLQADPDASVSLDDLPPDLQADPDASVSLDDLPPDLRDAEGVPAPEEDLGVPAPEGDLTAALADNAAANDQDNSRGMSW